MSWPIFHTVSGMLDQGRGGGRRLAVNPRAVTWVNDMNGQTEIKFSDRPQPRDLVMVRETFDEVVAALSEADDAAE